MTTDGTRVDTAVRSTTDLLDHARDTGRVIRCISSEGVCTEYVSVDGTLPDHWIRHSDLDGDHAHICERPTVRNAVVMCDPDVFLVDRDDSWFGGENGDA